MRIGTVTTLAAHGMAWAAAAFLAIGPVSSSGESLIEFEGRSAIRVLLVPVALTGIALAGVRFTHGRQSNRALSVRTMLLWSPAIVLAGLCILAMFSIGAYYLPAALALLVAAIADTRATRRTPLVGP